jgi:hypothetical protein
MLNHMCLHQLLNACRYPRGNGIGVDLAAEGIGKDLKGTPLEVGYVMRAEQAFVLCFQRAEWRQCHPSVI